MRHQDWQPRLLAALPRLARTPFAWGAHDCAIGAAQVADAISDGNYVERLLKQFKYRSSEEVDLILTSGGGLRSMMNEFMPQPEIPWGQATAGDVVLVVDFADREVLGVCEGGQVICAGVGPLPMARAVCAWRIA